MTEKPKAMVPKVRFRGFTDEWKQLKFNEIAVREKETHSSSHNLPGVEYDDIDSGTGRLNKDIRTKKISKRGIIFNENDVLFGKLRPYLKNWLNPHFEGVAVGDWWVLRPKNRFNTDFIYCLIQTRKFFFATNQTTGSKMPRSDWNFVSASLFLIPFSSLEQHKIASLILKLDKTITLHQQRLDQLNTLKKALLQKMFADKKHHQPELRFKEFSGDWEQEELKEISKIFIGLVTSMTKNYSDHGAFLIRNSNITENHISHDNPIYLNQAFADRNKNRKLKLGDVVTVHTGDIGTSAVIGQKEDGAIGFATINTRPNSKVLNSLFLSAYLNTHSHKQWAQRMSTGDGRSNYNLYDFIRIKIFLPSLDEQEKIGIILHKVEHIITLHQKKLNHLKSLKKSLLQTMFI